MKKDMDLTSWKKDKILEMIQSLGESDISTIFCMVQKMKLQDIICVQRIQMNILVNACTCMFGNIIMEKFLRDVKYIMLMVISLIMILVIYNVSQKKHIESITLTKCPKNKKNN